MITNQLGSTATLTVGVPALTLAVATPAAGQGGLLSGVEVHGFGGWTCAETDGLAYGLGDSDGRYDNAEKDAELDDQTELIVHGKSVGAVKSYWQEMIFSGRATPPPELSNNTEILAFVRSNPGAIGTVSANASCGDGLAEVEIEN